MSGHHTHQRNRGQWLVLAALALTPILACGERVPQAPARPNIMLITFESLRTDHVGALGGRSPANPDIALTPHIDALAAEGTIYPDAHSVTSWTLASHASIFTGLYPLAHQTRLATSKLGDSYDTIAEILAGVGYQTAGVISGPYLRPAHNLDQGFELYDFQASAKNHGKAHSDTTNPHVEEALLRFLGEQRDPQRPFFLFTYIWDPHYDFLPPPPYDQMFVRDSAVPVDMHGFESSPAIRKGMEPGKLEYLWSQYAGEIRATDEMLGRIFARMKELGLWDDTIVILTADHGEEFFDHGAKGHYNNVYAETTHVPLVIKYPNGERSGRDERLVSHVDILPTLLEALGEPVPSILDGVSLLAPDPAEDREVYYELHAIWHVFDQKKTPESHRVMRKTWLGVRRGDLKLVHHVEPKHVELYDVRRDPAEQQNILREHPAEARALAGLLDRWQGVMRNKAMNYQRGGEAELSPAETEMLKAMGYLRDDAPAPAPPDEAAGGAR